ncbi:hypothetical protein HY045_02350 [Candidatus Woesebacteria bacterium]|nr:hypothetical protein [Candidatus Woesebacteria bacterium]
MNDALSARQTQILKLLIDEYITTAEAVGSEFLDKRYNLGVSPATIRNEMVLLTKLGYLRQPHTSAGRVPTPKAMKFYINQLMEEREMSLADEVLTKEEVWNSRRDLDDFLEEAVHSLAERTKSLAVAANSDGKTWHAGEPYVFTSPEFSDIRVCASLFSFLDEDERIKELFFVRCQGLSPIEVIFGEELGWPGLSLIGTVITTFNYGNKRGALGVIGPLRLSYSTVIPVLRYFKKLAEEAVK